MLLEKRRDDNQANPAIEKLFGYTEKESLGKKLQDIGILLDMGDFQMTMQNLNKNGMTKFDDVRQKQSLGSISIRIYIS